MLRSGVTGVDMSYCISCGVKLQDHMDECPLCKTKVYHPEIIPAENPHPQEYEEIKQGVIRKAYLLVLSFAFLLPITASMNIDFSLNGAFTWSSIVAISTALFWFYLVAPFVIRKLHIIYKITIICWATAAYLFGLNLLLGGLGWSIFAGGGVILFWVMAIIPFMIKKYRLMTSLILDVIFLLSFLYIVEHRFLPHGWFVQLGLPLVLTLALTVFIQIYTWGKYHLFRQLSLLLISLGILNVGIDFIVSSYLEGALAFRAWSSYVLVFSIIFAIIFFILSKQTAVLEELKRRFHIWDEQPTDKE
jgi:hypothetical protein